MSENLDVFSAMQTEAPYKTYKKTILGKVYVVTIDPFSGQPIGVMLHGDPKKGDTDAYIDMWSVQDDMFFKKANRVHFERGVIIESERKVEPVKENSYEQATDEELTGILKLKFLALQSKLNKITSTAVLFRLLGIAEELEKSAAIMNAIKARLADLGAPVDDE